MNLELQFKFARETKNTYRYEEVADSGLEKIGVIYVKKHALGAPVPEITVNIQVK